MSDDCLDRLTQHLVLAVGVRDVVRAFELDTDREVIALLPASKRGPPRVPSTTCQGHILDELPRRGE